MKLQFHVYPIKIKSVIDGDSAYIWYDKGHFQGLGGDKGLKIRISGLDTHECRRIKRNGKYVTAAEVAKGKEAKQVAEDILLSSKRVFAGSTFKLDKPDIYGRFGTYLYFSPLNQYNFPLDKIDWISYADHMRNLGYDRDQNPL